MVELLYSHLKGQFFVVKPSCSEYLQFYAPPGQLLGDHKEKVRNALLKHGLKYASQRVLNDKDLVLPALEKHPDQLKYVSEELRDDSDVVMASVRRASQKVLKDRQCMLDLIEINPQVFKYAASELKDDAAFIEAAKQRNPELRQYLR